MTIQRNAAAGADAGWGAPPAPRRVAQSDLRGDDRGTPLVARVDAPAGGCDGSSPWGEPRRERRHGRPPPRVARVEVALDRVARAGRIDAGWGAGIGVGTWIDRHACGHGDGLPRWQSAAMEQRNKKAKAFLRQRGSFVGRIGRHLQVCSVSKRHLPLLHLLCTGHMVVPVAHVAVDLTKQSTHGLPAWVAPDPRAPPQSTSSLDLVDAQRHSAPRPSAVCFALAPCCGSGTSASGSTGALRENFAGYPAFLAPGSRKQPDPVALKSISVGNRVRSTDPAARRSGPNSKHHSKPPERAPIIAAGQKIQDLGRSVARRALHVRRSSAPQCVAQIAGAWAACPPPDAHS